MPRSLSIDSYSPMLYELTETAYARPDTTPLIINMIDPDKAIAFCHDFYGWRTALRIDLKKGNKNVVPILEKANCIRLSRRQGVIKAFNQFYSQTYAALKAALLDPTKLPPLPPELSNDLLQESAPILIIKDEPQPPTQEQPIRPSNYNRITVDNLPPLPPELGGDLPTNKTPPIKES